MDDAVYLSDNPQVRRGLSVRGAAWALSSVGYAGNWHPVTWLSHMLDVELFGMDPGRHHAVSILLHALNAALLLLVLEAWTGALWRSALVAALFAVHPLHVESVAWIAERKDILCGFFWILTMAAWIRSVRRPGRAPYAAAVTAFALALMAKPMAVTLPLVLLLLDFWPLGRWVPGRDRGGFPAALVTEKLPFLVLAAGASLMTWVAQSRAGFVLPGDTHPVGARVANALVSWVKYLALAAWPERLSVLYRHPGAEVDLGRAAAAAAALAAVTWLGIRLRRSFPPLAVGWLWYLGTLVPVIGLVQVGEQGMADRYTYLPLTGILMILAWGGVRLAAGRPRAQAALAAVAVLTVGAAAVAARARVELWRDDLLLFERAVEVDPANWTAHAAAARLLAKRDEVGAAAGHYEAALRIHPGLPELHNELALALARMGRHAEAGDHWRTAIEQRPDYAEAHGNLAVHLAEEGRLAEAIGHYRTAVRLRPDYAEAHFNLGVDLAVLGRLDEAAASLERAVRLRPDSAAARYRLGAVLLRLGRPREAEPHLRAALSQRPGWPEAEAALERAQRDAR